MINMPIDLKKSVKDKSTNPFILMEEEVLDFWEKNKTFEKSVKQKNPQGDYVFYDGPPFGTGEPHYGHILSSVSKDVVPRYWTMKGYRVERRWGWDCHGLPIENIIETDLKISGKKQIEKMGIAKFNEACRSRVLKYAGIWDDMVRRIGRWVDFKNSYNTMDKTYMESVWWGFKEMWKKGLIYEGKKVLLYCPRCETPISNFEVAMDNSYKDVIDKSLYIKFKAINAKQKLGLDGDIFILAWTTTPWTLPANMALAINEKIDYVAVKSDSTYILAKDRLTEIFKDKKVEIIKELKSKELVGLEYEPLFAISLPKEEIKKKAFYLIIGDFVNTEEGTGIVHIAPAYGEDDYKIAQKFNLPIVSILDERGHFTQIVPEFIGLYFEKANNFIINKLTEQKTVFASTKISHSYPHCHRCNTKLFYNAIPAWFLNINKIRKKMLKYNQKINWYPKYLKEGRFAKGIEQAPDWNISRNRYFATPIPIWRCEKCGKLEVIGSVDELKNKSGVSKIDDIHNHNIDDLTWKCPKCNHKMRRIKEVFDCWVESGSMPFAQMHYPFENKQKFKDNFPAKFISEYISQTRAWFYVMHAISTSLFDSHSFENVVTTGVILTSNGEKMSKSKKNFPDPFKIINEFGADALRAYLMGSSVMHANNLFFNENEVRDLFRKNIVILWNVYKFYEMYAIENKFKFNSTTLKVENILDKWILARLNELIKEVTTQMDKYDLPFSVRPLGNFINDLSTWYIRRSRDRFKSENEIDKQTVLNTTGYILTELAKVMAPFMPFIAEQIWQRITNYQFKNEDKSVHLEKWPISKPINKTVLSQMKLVRKIVEAGLEKRTKANIKIRQPLPYYSTDLVKEMPPEYIGIIKDELNIMELRFGINELGIKITEELLKEGIKRELVRSINAMRKKAGLTIQDKIKVYWSIPETDLSKSVVKNVFTELNKELARDVLANKIREEYSQTVDLEKKIKINNETIWLGIKKIY
jgi:isoleucyl-tRNA synthetase